MRDGNGEADSQLVIEGNEIFSTKYVMRYSRSRNLYWVFLT